MGGVRSIEDRKVPKGPSAEAKCRRRDRLCVLHRASALYAAAVFAVVVVIVDVVLVVLDKESGKVRPRVSRTILRTQPSPYESGSNLLVDLVHRAAILPAAPSPSLASTKTFCDAVG